MQAAGPSTSPQTCALKCLSKRGIVDSGLRAHDVREKEITAKLHRPFVLKFLGAVQDDHTAYFFLEIPLRGEIFRVLRAEGQFPEARSYFSPSASCCPSTRSIRARSPAAGRHLEIVDFGLAKKLAGGRTWTLCGTPDYLAPEVVLSEGHDWAVDYWAPGVPVYKMTAGRRPSGPRTPWRRTHEKILAGHVSVPAHFGHGPGELHKKLLKTHQSKRPFRTKGGAGAVLKQKWFLGFDWNSLWIQVSEFGTIELGPSGTTPPPLLTQAGHGKGRRR